MKYINYLEIINEIKVNFSLSKEVRIIFKDLAEGAAETQKLPFRGYIIFIDKDKLTGASKTMIKGLLAHELAHIEDFNDKGWFYLMIFVLKYKFSDNFRKRVEYSADKIAIKAGFRRELRRYREYRLKTGSEQDRKVLEKYYLSPKEIENLSVSSLQ